VLNLYKPVDSITVTTESSTSQELVEDSAPTHETDPLASISTQSQGFIMSAADSISQQQAASVAPVIVSEEEALMEAINAETHEIPSLLTTRITSLRAVKAMWAAKGTLSSLLSAIARQPASVKPQLLVDLLSAVRQVPEVLTCYHFMLTFPLVHY